MKCIIQEMERDDCLMGPTIDQYLVANCLYMIDEFNCEFSLRMTKKQKSEKSRKNLTNAEKLRVSEIQTTQKCHS